MTTLAAALAISLLSLAASLYFTRRGAAGKLAVLEDRLARAEVSLEACLRDRARLQQTLQLVVSAIIGLLPRERRTQLLQALDEAVKPNGGEDQPWRRA